jgi:hypothetical protein
MMANQTLTGAFSLPRLATFSPSALVVRDNSTLEFRQFYPLPRHRDEEHNYALSVYFFFPRSFGMTPQTWPKEVFDRSTQTFLRLHAPLLTLKDLSNLDHPDNPVGLLRQRLPLLLSDNAPRGSSMTMLAQMFGAEITDALTRESWTMRRELRHLGQKGTAAQLWQHLQNYCADSLAALFALRRVQLKARAYQGVVHPRLLQSLSFAEEYATAMVDENLSEIAISIEDAVLLRNGTGAALKMRLLIASTLETLNRHRREQGFILPHIGTDYSSEYYTYRLSLLKKELQRALYVDTRALRRDPFVANSAAMVAAGLAATWATLAQIPLLSGGWDGSERYFLFGAAVGAYVLKDRIKDWVKHLLAKLWLPWDHDHAIVGDLLAEVGLGSFTGRTRERFRWLREGDVPDNIVKLRAAQRTVRGASVELEQVAYYHRLISLKGSELSPVPRGFGVQEILRLSVADILRRLDDPADQISFYDGVRGRFMQASMPKVYHLNVVYVTTDLNTGQSFRNRARVVLNQKQLLRVESVMQQEETLPPKK